MNMFGGKEEVEKKSPVDLLTTEQLEEFQEAFATFDEDGSGTIDRDELKRLLEFAGQAPTNDELTEMINIIDVDGTGDINFPEFVTLMAHKMATETSNETLQSAFNVFDTDGSGVISAEEFHRVIHNLGETSISVEDLEEVMTGKEVADYIKKSLRDLDDGSIRFNKFKQIVQDEKTGGIQGEAAVIKAVEGEGQHGQLGYGKRVSLSDGKARV